MHYDEKQLNKQEAPQRQQQQQQQRYMITFPRYRTAIKSPQRAPPAY